MTSVIPNEGEQLRAQMVWARTLTDRDADLELGLFTNSAAGETLTEASVTEPTGGSYARKDLTDGSWTVTGGIATYAQQTFTASGSAYTGTIYGYFIATKAAGGTPRILGFEIDDNGPYTIPEDGNYVITPQIQEF